MHIAYPIMFVRSAGPAVRSPDDQLYHCDRCPKRYAHAARLRRHYAGHTGERPYGCDYCAQRFQRAEHKRRHMAIHTNERRHECEFCERRFVRADHLRAHLKTHEGVLPYQCPVCRQRFGTAKQKQEHMRRHTGAYRCEMCLERFESFAELSEHRRDIHLLAETRGAEILVGRQEHYPCPVCKVYYSIVRLGDHLKLHVADGEEGAEEDDDEEAAGVGRMVYADGQAVPRYGVEVDDDDGDDDDDGGGEYEDDDATALPMAMTWSPQAAHVKREYAEMGREQF